MLGDRLSNRRGKDRTESAQGMVFYKPAKQRKVARLLAVKNIFDAVVKRSLQRV